MLKKGFRNVFSSIIVTALIIAGFPALSFANESSNSSTSYSVSIKSASPGGDIGATQRQGLEVSTTHPLTSFKWHRISVFDITNGRESFIGSCDVSPEKKSCIVWINDFQYPDNATPGVYQYKGLLEGTDEYLAFSGSPQYADFYNGKSLATPIVFEWERLPFSLSLEGNSLYVSSGGTNLDETIPTLTYSLNQFPNIGGQYAVFILDVTNDRIVYTDTTGFKSWVFEGPMHEGKTVYYRAYLAKTGIPVHKSSDLVDIKAVSNDVSKTRRSWDIAIEDNNTGVNVVTKKGGGNYISYLADRATGEIFWTSKDTNQSVDEGYRGYPAGTTDWAKAYVAKSWDSFSSYPLQMFQNLRT